MFRYVLFVFLTTVAPLLADEHNHPHHGDSDTKIERPKVYLDKKRRIVDYQLKRLDNARLLLVETATDDPKYIPVFDAIIRRPGMARKDRDDAVSGLAVINKTDVATELLAALESLNSKNRDQQRVGHQISTMLLGQPVAVLADHADDFGKAIASDNDLLKSTAHAAFIVTANADKAWEQALQDVSSKQAWLAAVPLVPAGSLRDGLRDGVISLLDPTESSVVWIAAIQALAQIAAEPADTFQRLAPYVSLDELRIPAVRSLLKVPADARDGKTSRQLVEVLVGYAEQTPAAQRTTDEFLDVLQLADELLSRLSVEESAEYRTRLREVTVRVVRLRSVEEEMRYDRPFFAVEAGRPVQVVFENEDLMPHNLVITANGKLKVVALAGAALGITPGLGGNLYVPDNHDVLFYTGMVNAGQRETLTFNAPTEPGEYPYVCTFPRHWMRMYGVMMVVPDLDEWQRNPTTPKDPLGNNRSFVKNWNLTDFPEESIAEVLGNRNPGSGARLFKEATCLSCHKVHGQGGAVGPELMDVLKRFKDDRHAVLREILEPSYRIDPKYAVKVVIDIDGKTTSGIVTAEDKKSISILVNPEVPQPTVIQKDDIDEIIPSTLSMMPKALLDKFTHDEIMEILDYLTSTKLGE
jgi:putative heme-binding domain-containing protein